MKITLLVSSNTIIQAQSITVVLKLYHGTESTNELGKIMSAWSHLYSFWFSSSIAERREGQCQRFYISSRLPNYAHVAGAETTLCKLPIYQIATASHWYFLSHINPLSTMCSHQMKDLIYPKCTWWFLSLWLYISPLPKLSLFSCPFPNLSCMCKCFPLQNHSNASSSLKTYLIPSPLTWRFFF